MSETSSFNIVERTSLSVYNTNNLDQETRSKSRHRRKHNCTNQQPPQRGGAVPDPVWVGWKWLLAFPRVPITLGTPLTQTIFSQYWPLNDRKEAAHSLFKIGRPFFLFFWLSLAYLLILLLLLMSGNDHPNPVLAFSCLVCAGNETWRDRSVQCCTCSKGVHLRCSLLSFFLDSKP